MQKQDTLTTNSEFVADEVLPDGKDYTDISVEDKIQAVTVSSEEDEVIPHKINAEESVPEADGDGSCRHI